MLTVIPFGEHKSPCESLSEDKESKESQVAHQDQHQ